MEASATVERGFESVTSYLACDHHRLDEALRSVSSAVTSGTFGEAVPRYERFESGLLCHLRVEEELVFPVFEARSGMINGPTDTMRNEHRQVRMALALMRRGLLQSDAIAYNDGLRFFESVLPDHNAKEEHILYPALDGLLRPAERAALIARLHRESAR
jgi:iron-sulfur cluster repair protein YtfE (RIC family)